MSDNEYDYAALLRPKCKVCSSAYRKEIDLMLMGKECHEDGERFTYDEIIDWCAANGLNLSKASLSRHKTDHLMPDVLTAIEAKKHVEAVAQATGETLGFEAAFLNMLVNKAMRALSEHELDAEGKWIGTTVRAIETLLKIRKAEVTFSKEKLEQAKGTMRSKGVSEEALKTLDDLLMGG